MSYDIGSRKHVVKKAKKHDHPNQKKDFEHTMVK